MTSNLPNLHLNPFKYHSIQFNFNPTFSFVSSKSRIRKPKKIPPLLSINCNLSSPPKSKEEAIRQAKTCLSTTLEKPLNNPKLAAGKLKKLKQPRFRVEIPVIDDSPESLSQLALQVFDEMPLKKRGSKVKIVILWPNSTLTEAANKVVFGSKSSSNLVEHVDVSSFVGDLVNRVLNSADVVVFLTPEASQLEAMEMITNSLYPKPVVIFNPRWGYEEEDNKLGDFNRFLGSFEVIYSFMGLEVQGLLSKKNGMVFKNGEKWSILVEEEGELKAVSSFKTRPSITEVENVLYNLMAINSPITKSAKFLKDLVSNVTGKRT